MKLSFNPKNWFSQEKKTANPNTKTFNIPPDSFLSYAFGESTWVTAAMAMEFYRQTSAIATAVDMIADAIKQIQPVIQGQDKKFSDSDPILELLQEPNGIFDWMGFMGTLSRDYLLKHDSIVLSAGNINRPPLELWPQSLQSISIIENHDTYPDSYIVTRGILPGQYIRKSKLRKIKFYDGNLKELSHIRGYASRTTKVESDSPLQAAALEAKQIIKGKYHNVKLLENGGRLSLMVTFNDDDYVTQEEHDDRVKSLNEQYSGTNNAGKIGVISGADVQHVKEFGKSNKDMDFATLETMASNAIYLRYQIPLALITTEASTFDNLKTGIELLYDNAVLPNANVLFSGLTRLLMPRFGRDPNKERITYNPESIQPLKQRMLDEVSQRQKTGIETTDELRSLMQNRDKVKGGDVIYTQSSMVPLGTEPEPTQTNSGTDNEE